MHSPRVYCAQYFYFLVFFYCSIHVVWICFFFFHIIIQFWPKAFVQYLFYVVPIKKKLLFNKLSLLFGFGWSCFILFFFSSHFTYLQTEIDHILNEQLRSSSIEKLKKISQTNTNLLELVFSFLHCFIDWDHQKTNSESIVHRS